MATDSKTITDLADDVAGKAGETGKKAADKVSDVVVEVKDGTADIVEKAGESARSAASTGRDYAAEGLAGLASAARQIAGRLGDSPTDGGNARAAEYARKAADSIDKFSARLREKEVDEIAEDARSAVRNNPAIAVGAAAVIGFALARFLKGSGGREA
jgi:ElaB/YqjD/DUF883 family membrane-anchored ribosome-binding protein